MLTVSNSKINTWRRCHYAYHLKYVEKLNKKVKDEALQRGSIIHECIEAYHSGKSWKRVLDKFGREFYKESFSEEIVISGDIPKMARELLENYFYYYEDEDLEYLQNELHFKLPLTKDIEIEGYIDSVVSAGGKIWPMETKTYSRTPDLDFLMFNNQSSIYLWALGELGYNSEGMLWNIIKAKEPSKPTLTKKGVLSKAALDSTPYTVKKGIIELGLDPKKYQDFIDSHDFSNFFYRHQLRLNKNVVKGVIEDTISTAEEIMDKGGILKDRNLGRDCSWCSYKNICQAELLNLDVDYIIKSEYTIKSKEEEVICQPRKQKRQPKKARRLQ